MPTDTTAKTAELPAYVQEALRGLTPAQQRTVISGHLGGESMALARTLQRKHLFYLKIDSPNGRWGTLELTPLGVTVQRILKARAQAKSEANRHAD